MKRRIALVAHDNKKNDLMEWADFNKGTLSYFQAMTSLLDTGYNCFRGYIVPESHDMCRKVQSVISS